MKIKQSFLFAMYYEAIQWIINKEWTFNGTKLNSNNSHLIGSD